MLNSPVFIGLVGRLLGGSQRSLLRFLVRAWSRGMLAFSRATSSAINNQGAMHMQPFAFQPAPNWAVKRTPTQAMPSAFSWPVLVPCAPAVLRRRLPWALGLLTHTVRDTLIGSE